MKTKNLVIFIIICLAITGIAFLVLSGVLFKNSNTSIDKLIEPQPVELQIQNKNITDDTNPFIIKINYPYINGLDIFNQKVQEIIDKELTDFKKYSLDNDATVKQTNPIDYAKYPRTYELNIGYDKGEIDNDIISIIFNVYTFEGGAHGASYYIPLNYNPKTKTEIKLAELFPSQPDYLKKVSDYCIKDLTQQVITKLGDTSGTWIQDGASPTEENYSFFLINKSNIVFYFPQYQIAYGAAGDFQATMPR